MITVITKIIRIHLPRPRYKIISEIALRWSPRHYSDEKIPQEHINIIFEAPRWAPSGHNHQPWYFYTAKKGTGIYEKLFSTLDEYNQSWAKTAPLLILACAITSNTEGKNPYAFYDLGAAVLSLILQAQSLGYYSRQMALFDKQKVKEFFKLDKNHEPFTIIAMGKIGDYTKASKQVIDYEFDPRPRKTDLVKELETRL
ncbi:MAG: Nitroreductase family protein [Candidatus Amesbacteria bacterium GW2011_GWB1_47_19]|nr:MAG: Nitroreductase family protein [Candidatus Amesbacteria bacterium GW2011_GWA1_44_24]KKU31251.1 MAG: Nitroreductase family protein [Candidatus Amesbacteria bacterium GW2011_GWC1_46_24]KKU67095.1 MAG: Nitroreductase family protein [Candidatus Amesbacteria bacterium GW2011_GWB1_47_19]HBC72964.1 nitroreductase [Candidatus Amesbacteria bacterium]